MVIDLFHCLSHSFSALSSIIASLLSSPPSCFLSPSLNPLYYSHVSPFNSQAPSCHAFSVLCSLCSAIPSSFTPPLYSPSTPPLRSVSDRLLCKASSVPTEAPPDCSGDLLKLYQCGHTKVDGWQCGPFLIWSLAFIPWSTQFLAFCHFTVCLFLSKRLLSESEAKWCDLSYFAVCIIVALSFSYMNKWNVTENIFARTIKRSKMGQEMWKNRIANVLLKRNLWHYVIKLKFLISFPLKFTLKLHLSKSNTLL